MPHNLYDRFNTRPFLMNIEKIWITYQLLRSVTQCNSIGIRHGDIKSENVLLTSWNWVFLSDFSFFKPCYLPEDDPAGYYYFFNSGGRRRCYVAPERFYSDYADLDAKTAAVAKKRSLQTSKGEKNNSSMKNIELHKHALEHAAVKLKRRITAGKKEQGESFSSMNHGPQYGIISESMDIFSLGCVIAELFLMEILLSSIYPSFSNIGLVGKSLEAL